MRPRSRVGLGGASGIALVWGLLILWASPAGAQPWERYIQRYHGPYRGRVVDAETKQPLAGAVVVAIWDRRKVQLFQATTVFYEAREVLTDANGEFVLHAEDIEGSAPAQTLRPTFKIFFPGYGWYPRYHVTPQGFLGGIFEGAGVTVELPRLKMREERLKAIGGLPPYVPDEKIPNFLRLMNIEEINLGLKPTHLPKGMK